MFIFVSLVKLCLHRLVHTTYVDDYKHWRFQKKRKKKEENFGLETNQFSMGIDFAFLSCYFCFSFFFFVFVLNENENILGVLGHLWWMVFIAFFFSIAFNNQRYVQNCLLYLLHNSLCFDFIFNMILCVRVFFFYIPLFM